MAENCIFCKIAAGQAPASIVYQDDQVTVFNDRVPAAPIHLLIIPNRHIDSLNAAAAQDAELLGYLLMVARQQAEQHDLSKDGYRLVINTGANAGQTVFHLHLHLMGGRRMPGLAQ